VALVVVVGWLQVDRERPSWLRGAVGAAAVDRPTVVEAELATLEHRGRLDDGAASRCQGGLLAIEIRREEVQPDRVPAVACVDEGDRAAVLVDVVECTQAVSISCDVQVSQYCRSVCQPTLAGRPGVSTGLNSSWSCQSRMPAAPLSRVAIAPIAGDATSAASSSIRSEA